jgi:hypothetical protein
MSPKARVVSSCLNFMARLSSGIFYDGVGAFLDLQDKRYQMTVATVFPLNFEVGGLMA